MSPSEMASADVRQAEGRVAGDAAPTSPAASPATSPAAARTARRGLSRRWLLAGLLVVAGLAFFATGSDGWFTVVNFTLIAAIIALGLNVLSGYAGQVSLGVAFFMALGAYTAAFLGGAAPTSSRDPLGLGLPFYIWLPAAGIVAALVGALVGPTALRLKGFYLGIVSLALVFIGQHAFKNIAALAKISGGPQGRSFPAPTIGDASLANQNEVLGIALTTHQQYFLLLVPILALAAIFVGNVMRSRAGRAMQAVRDNEVGAAIMGVNLLEAKLGAFVLSSFLAGVGGALYASYGHYVNPDYWDLVLSVQFVAAIIIGGVASVWGSILGAAFVFALPQVIDALSLLPQSADAKGLTSGDLNAIIYGLLIMLFLLFQPTGIAGLFQRGRFAGSRRWWRRGSRKPTDHAHEGGEPARTTP